jgi:tellurite methyltransferase
MAVYGKGEPENIIVQLAEKLPRGSMTLDMGSGEGRNALYLARHGIKVEAWDKDAREIGTLKALAAKENLEIHAEVCDMRDFRIGYNNRDAIINSFSLHYLRPEDAIERLHHIRTSLKRGGYHAILQFTENGDLARAGHQRFFPKVDETLKAYAKWEIITKSVEMRPCAQRGPQGQELNNEVLVLLARKPL